MTDAIVIGAGHNGLTCAAYLARAGKQVLCLDAAGKSGGMAATRSFAGDYRVAGLTHLAYPVSAQIRRDLDLDKHGYQPGVPVDTVVLDSGGAHLTVARDRIAGDQLSDADLQAYPEFMRQYLGFAKALKPFLASKPPRLKDMDFADKKSLARLGWNMRVGLGRESMYEFLRVAAINIYDVLNDSFTDERLKSCLAMDAVLGSAMGPCTPGTVLTWLHRLQGALNGPMSMQLANDTALVAALRNSAEAAGATIQTYSTVKRIQLVDGRAVGVELEDGELISAEIVACSADPRTTFQSLVGAPGLDAMFANRVSQIRGSGVVAKLNIALRDLPKFRGIDEKQMGNRFLIAASMRHIERAFNHSKYGEVSTHPALEITIPSVHEASMAPDGHHVMSVNIAYAPYELEGGWGSQKEYLANLVISQLDEFAPGFESLVVANELLTPADIEARYRAHLGHWHHGELSIHQSLMMRPLYGAAQYNTPIENLFLCGAGCHPGGDLTGLPGRNAAQRILEMGVQ